LLQFPWSLALGSGWAATGMMTNFLTPANSVNRYTNQSTFVIERQFGERAFLFAEYVGKRGGYRITLTQQIDFHTSVGLNRNAPAYIFGLGYSLRRDKLFE
jgi:beta-lactamase superfamily II metal-dependent hydrolase